MSSETCVLMIRCMRVSFLLNLLLFCVLRSLLFWLVFVFDFVRVSLSKYYGERISHVYITGKSCLRHIHLAQILIFIEHRYLLYFIESVLSYYLWMLSETRVLMIRCMRVYFLLNLLPICVIRSLLFWLGFEFDIVFGWICKNINFASLPKYTPMALPEFSTETLSILSRSLASNIGMPNLKLKVEPLRLNYHVM